MKLDYISARGDRLPLVNNDLFYLTNVDGMTIAGTSIASSTIGGADGDIVNNVQANVRQIVLDLRIRNGVDVEEAKRAVLRIVKIKQKGSLEWTQNDTTVTISGIVESIDMPRWNNAGASFPHHPTTLGGHKVRAGLPVLYSIFLLAIY